MSLAISEHVVYSDLTNNTIVEEVEVATRTLAVVSRPRQELHTLGPDWGHRHGQQPCR